MKGQGEADRPRAERTTVVSRGSKGYVTDIFTELCVELHPRTTHAVPSSPMLSHKALHPEHASAGGWHRRGRSARAEVRPRGTSQDGSTQGRLCLAAGQLRRRAAAASPRWNARIEGLPPLGSGTVPRPTATSATDCDMLVAVDEGLGRIMDVAREAGRPRQDHRDPGRRQRLLLRGARPERGAAPRLRGVDPPAPARCGIRRAFAPGSTPAGQALTIDIAPTILDLAAATPLAGIDGRSLVALFSAGGTPAGWRRSFLVEYHDRRRLSAHAEDGLRRGQERPLQVHPLP